MYFLMSHMKFKLYDAVDDIGLKQLIYHILLFQHFDVHDT
jgi:hypothetical protein